MDRHTVMMTDGQKSKEAPHEPLPHCRVGLAGAVKAFEWSQNGDLQVDFPLSVGHDLRDTKKAVGLP